MSDRELPARPSLEQYKKQAKDLVRHRADAAPEALERIQHHHPRLRNLPEADIQRAAFKLSDAQLVIAREHAFETWSKFARHVQTRVCKKYISFGVHGYTRGLGKIRFGCRTAIA